MATNRAPLLQQITQSPLMIAEDSQELFQSSIEHITTHPHAADFLASTSNLQNDDEDFWPKPDAWDAKYRPYVVKNGVLQIPVMGVLLSRFPWQLGRWATGYQYIEKALARGLEDFNVKKIAFICDTPGGEVTECFELGDKIYEARGQKPMRSFAANHAYSAGYLIFSSANDGAVTRSGGVGSIGVVTAHVEYSDALKEMGIKVTFIFAGKHKVDGNPYEKLSDAVKSRIQGRINRIYGVFTSAVARNRSMDDSAVRATEALTYDADEAIQLGLADRIGALDDEMIVFADGTEQSEDEEMAQNDNTISQATHDAAVASARTEGQTAGKTEGIAEGKATGMAEGATAAKTRITAILGCEQAKTRPIAAMAAAMDTDMTVEQASAFLAKIPAEKAATPEKKPVAKTAFETAMEKDNPNVGAETGEDDDADGDQPEAKANSILVDYSRAAGGKAKKKAA